MAGGGRQQKNRVFVGGQLEGLGKAFRWAMKFRAKVPVLFAILLDPSVPAGHLLRVPAEKEFALQIGQSYPIPGRKPVLLRKGNVTTRLCQLSRVKFRS